MAIVLGATVGPDSAYKDGTTLQQRFEAWVDAQGKRPRLLGEFLDPRHNMADGALRTYASAYGGLDLLKTADSLRVSPYIHFNIQLRDSDTYEDMIAGAPTVSGLSATEHVARIGRLIGTCPLRVRFMHEFNAGQGSWWDRLTSKQFISTFQMFSRGIRQYAPHTQICFCIASAGRDNWRDFFPGAEYANAVGVDAFPAVDPEKNEQRYENLDGMYTFAQAKNLSLQMPAVNFGGGEDNPELALRLCRWIVAHRDRLRYVGIGEAKYKGSDVRIGTGTHPNVLEVWRKYATRELFLGS